MSARAVPAPRPGFAIPGSFIGAVALGIGTAIGIASLVALGPIALFIPLIMTMVVLAVLYPRIFVYLLLAGAIVLEPDAIDPTRPIARAMFTLPEGLKSIVPITTSPMELWLVAAAASLWIRGRGKQANMPPLPRLVNAVPIVIFFGLAWGARSGGDLPLAYNEARGLLFGMVIFLVALRMSGEPAGRLLKVLMISSTLLSLVTINRWFFYTREGNSPVPVEFAFAHENAVLFGIAVVVSGMCLLRAQTNGARFWLIAHMLLVLLATFVTGRRAGTMVLLMGGLTVAWLLLPKRPIAVLAISIPVLCMGATYLAVYWNHEYGAIAQPARAIRSQISPSERDASSDDYRVKERFNVTETLKYNRILGIGFGRPFAQFEPLPDLTDFWPLQDYTPHQNVLWLWLKMGVAGIAVLMGLWMLALKRCLDVIRSTPRSAPLPATAVILASSLLMYLSYAQIDQALTGTRAIGALAIILAMSFRLRPYQQPGTGTGNSTP